MSSGIPCFERGSLDEATDPGWDEAMTNLMKRFAEDESGATAIEYGLIGALVSIAIVLGATQVGSNLADKFRAVAATVGATAPAGT